MLWRPCARSTRPTGPSTGIGYPAGLMLWKLGRASTSVGNLPGRIVSGGAGIVVLEKPSGGGLPYAPSRPGDRLPLLVAHGGGHEQGRSGCRRAHDAPAVFRARRVQTPEGTKQVGRRLGL